MATTLGRGIVYVAYGEKAHAEAKASIACLHGGLPVAVVSDKLIAGVQSIEWATPGYGARWAKLNIDKLSPWEDTLYLDADTRPKADVTVGFEILDDGWDLVVTPSGNQGENWLWHITDEERGVTEAEIGRRLQLQMGVFWFRKSEAMEQLFECWRQEWTRWGGEDQGAFLRALARCPVKIWLFGRPWNGGGLIAHHFGQVRR